MGLNFPTVAQHEAMNGHMRLMIGIRGEEQAHRAMGRAYAGCGTAAQRSGPYGGMMGGNWAGMMRGSGYGPGMMGGTGRSAISGRPVPTTGGSHGWSPLRSC